MRIAILGAGFAGLATAWYLLHHSQVGVSIDLYDPLPLGQGVSGISSGLLHLYGGRHAKRAPEGDKKMNSAHQLLGEAARALGKPVVLSTGILRPAVSSLQIEDFKKAAHGHPDTEWWEREKCEERVPGLKIPKEGGGLYLKQGVTLDVQTYLEGLWKALALFGTQFFQVALTSESQLQKYQRVIVASGYSITQFPAFSSLPVEAIKGQVLELEWNPTWPSLPFSLISEGYLTMGKERRTCIAGSTFEREFSDGKPDLAFAAREIRKKVSPFFPAIEECKVVMCKAGIRAAGKKNHLPLMGRISEKMWFLTGLGGKGLLYHAYLGDLLAQAVLQNETSLLPKEFRYGT